MLLIQKLILFLSFCLLVFYLKNANTSKHIKKPPVLPGFNSIVFFLSYRTCYFVSVTFKACDEMVRLLPKDLQYQLHCLKTRQVTRNDTEPWFLFCFGRGFLALNSLNIFDVGLTKLLAGFQIFYFNGSLTQ